MRMESLDIFQKPTETVLLIEGQGSLIREIRPRSAVDPSKTPIVISSCQLDDIKRLTQVATARDYQELRRRHRSTREAEGRHREDRRLRISEFDDRETQAESRKEKERRERSLAALERAIAININGEEALRKASSVVLGAKCFAVRDAQLQDAKQRQEQKKQKELEETGAVDIFESLKKREEKDAEKRKADGKKIAEFIQEQIKAKGDVNFAVKQRGEKVKDLERKAARRIKKEEEDRRLQQRKLMAKRAQEFQAYLQETITRKEMAKQRDKEEEMALVQYMEAKAKAESEKEAELARQKLEREQEVQRIRLLQQRERKRVMNSVDEQIQRAHEEAERMWMLREEREQLKKAKDRESYKQHHLEACEEARRKKFEEKQKALEKAKEDARIFAEKARKLDEQEEKERLEFKQHYLNSIVSQMEDDVRNRLRQKSASLEEHEKIKLARDIQETRIREAMKAKYLELAKGPVEEQHLGFVRAKFDKICKEQGIQPVTKMLTSAGGP